MQDWQPGIQLPARSSAERPRRRKAAAERERARAESELSRAAAMAMELEHQIEQTSAKARSRWSELQGARASSSRRSGGSGEVADDQPPASSTVYVEVMQELDRVKRELRKLQLEVKVAREAEASTTTSRTSFGSHFPGGVERDACDGNEEHALVELAGAGRSDEEAEETRTKTSRRTASDLEVRLATASSGVGLRRAEMAPVKATARNQAASDSSSSEASAKTARTHEEHDDDSSLEAAEAELNSAWVELESIREEGLRLMTSMERTRKETARVADEISRLTEQEEKANAQVKQLNAKLLTARSRLEAAAAADERADELLSNLTAMLQRLDEDVEEAAKEKALMELESRGVSADAESTAADIAAAEQRIRDSVRGLEEARAEEAAAARKLKAVVESVAPSRVAATSQRSGNVMIPRFEYEYLAGRAEVVRAVADKKVAAEEAWAEAWHAGEKEMVMRAEAIEREIGEGEGVAEVAPGEQARQSGPSTTVGRRKTTRTSPPPPPPSSVARNPSAPSFSVRRKKRPSYLKLITGRC